jgi:hypothetical protein
VTVVDPLEYQESLMTGFRKELNAITQNFQPTNPTEYLSRKETAKILQVSLVTLSAWNKKKILNPYRLGNLIRYKRKEIDQALISINPLKK